MDPLHPEEVYPALHAMLQYAPPAKVPVQLPIPPLATEVLLGMEQVALLAMHVGGLVVKPL